MNKVLEFQVHYYPATSSVCVELHRKNDGDAFVYDLMGEIRLWVSPWWHSIEDVERKVLKAKEKLFREYQRTKHFTLAVAMVAELASEGKMVIEDKETVDFIAQFKSRAFEKKAKVFVLPRR